MNLKMFKITMMTLFLAGSLFSCAKKEKENEENCTISTCLYGKWKIEKILYAWNNRTEVISEHIVYEFHPDGIMTVTAANDVINCGFFFTPGEYPFSILNGDEMAEFESDYFSGYPDLDWLVFGRTIYYFHFYSSKEASMYCYSYSDPIAYIFKKINQ